MHGRSGLQKNATMESTSRYDFDLPWRGAIVGFAIWVGLSSYMFRLERNLGGVIGLLLLLLGLVFAVLGFTLLIRRLLFPRVLEFDGEAILFPHGFFRTHITRVSFVDIIRASWTRTGLNLVTTSGSYELTALRFKNYDSYQTATRMACTILRIKMPSSEDMGRSGNRLCEYPAPILSWVEPEDWPRYRAQVVAAKPLVPRLAKALWFFVRGLCFILFPWFLLKMCRLPTASTGAYLCLAIIAMLFFTLLHWLYARSPARATEVSFCERGITQISGKQTRDLDYRDCSCWNIVERDFENRVLRVLLLRWRNHVVEVALPDSTTCDRLVQLFGEKRIPRSSDLSPSWEAHE